MNIGIIGAGEIGSCLAKKLKQLGHHVAIANSRGPESLQEFAKEQATVADAVKISRKEFGLTRVFTAVKVLKGIRN